jgi:hypothetical protein
MVSVGNGQFCTLIPAGDTLGYCFSARERQPRTANRHRNARPVYSHGWEFPEGMLCRKPVGTLASCFGIASNTLRIAPGVLDRSQSHHLAST